MQKIGEKILELRLSKGLTQENLIPENPSQVSQIEKKVGGIKRPTEPTLNKISKALGVDFKDLIDETDWSSGSSRFSSAGVAYSQTDLVVDIDKTGKIKVNRKIYPRNNQDGHENKYCPSMGLPLLVSCKECNRPYDDNTMSYCMGCGNEINSYTINYYGIINKQFWHDKEANLSEAAVVEETIESCKANINQSYNYYDIREELSTGLNPANVPEETDDEFLDNFMNNNKLWCSDAMWEGHNERYFNWESFRFKHKSPNRMIREVWLQHYMQLSYYYGILGELKRYEINIEQDISQHQTSKKVKKSKQEDR